MSRSWVKGKALETVINLGIVQEGDEILCAICKNPHRITATNHQSGAPIIAELADYEGVEYLRPFVLEEIIGWRRP